MAGGDEARASSAAGQVGSGGGRGEAQGVGAGEGGAPVPVREAALRLPQGAVPGAGEEQAAHRAAAGVHEPADRRPVCGGLTWGWCARRPQNAASAA